MSQTTNFDAGKVAFSVKVRDHTIDYNVFSIFALPGEKLAIEALKSAKSKQLQLEAQSGIVKQLSAHKWQWQAPATKGLYTLRIKQSNSEEHITLKIFVLIPFKQLKGEYLNGYRMGKYPTVLFKGLAIYKPPKGLIEVTEENEDKYISPHFRLKQFLCKQDGGYPKYIVLREKLLLKLELLLEKANQLGYRCNTFNILSGYRTPYYNKLIGNVKYSRHVWGGAADIFIDEHPRDDMMDDLNADGLINWKDAKSLYDLIDDFYGHKFYERFVGGLGRYKKTSNHGPFVHVDVRGFRARWGD
ncbi:MAG: peptidase M15A [candidate division Zixibacteria bacterium]|nr:peptidase M15A [candidate division Zixibacteria bacterium]NIV07565.1 peptidase M15A [candidate division Zixibacteria bacterium]